MNTRLLKFSVITFIIATLSAKPSFADDEIFHTHDYNRKMNISAIKKRISSSDDLCMDKDEELAMVDELEKFELGQFLLANGGLNGRWTAYLIQEAPKLKLKNDLENWMVNKAPVVRATQERSHIFQEQINKYLHTNSVVASVPCGTMHELHSLNFDGVYDVTLVGIDLDKESLKLAKEKFKPSRFYTTEFKRKNAWHLKDKEKYNIMVSNGLNIYEPNNDKVTDLYDQFYNALIPGGVLITSFLTPPPGASNKSTWTNYTSEDALKQKAIFKDIIQAKWQVFRTEEETRSQLKKAGFETVEVIYDSQGMFPTVVAKKAST